MSAPSAPLSRRPWDVAFIAFWLVNFGFITYMIAIAANLRWLLFPFAVIARMRREHPFGTP